jgi:lipopolysaccharide heptosyltransferase II
MWPQKYYIDLGNYLVKSGRTVVLFGGKDDKEICGEIAAEIHGAINLFNDNDLFKTAVDMKKCSALICNDSGMMHVACALKVPVVAIFGSTVSYFGFTPYKNKSIVLENESLSCRPCSHIGKDACPKHHFKCMTEITPLSAFNKFKSLQEFR